MVLVKNPYIVTSRSNMRLWRFTGLGAPLYPEIEPQTCEKVWY